MRGFAAATAREDVARDARLLSLIAIGARNAFDEYPPLDMIREECCGALYRSDSVVDWQGGYYYLRARHAF